VALQVPARPPLAGRVAVTYALVSSIWIVLSDRAVELLVQDSRLRFELSVRKGWLVVALTALLLYAYLSRQADRRLALLEAILRARGLPCRWIEAGDRREFHPHAARLLGLSAEACRARTPSRGSSIRRTSPASARPGPRPARAASAPSKRGSARPGTRKSGPSGPCAPPGRAARRRAGYQPPPRDPHPPHESSEAGAGHPPRQRPRPRPAEPPPGHPWQRRAPGDHPRRRGGSAPDRGPPEGFGAGRTPRPTLPQGGAGEGPGEQRTGQPQPAGGGDRLPPASRPAQGLRDGSAHRARPSAGPIRSGAGAPGAHEPRPQRPGRPRRARRHPPAHGPRPRHRPIHRPGPRRPPHFRVRPGPGARFRLWLPLDAQTDCPERGDRAEVHA
jgi:hypothetical protein